MAWSSRRLLALPAATLLLQSLIFLGMNWPRSGPLDWWFLSPVCLMPWIVFVACVPRARTAYLVSYLLGVLFYWLNTYYVAHITIAGHLALGVYFGAYYFLFALLVRPIVRQGHWQLTFVVPLAWVATEYLRSIGPLAFPFLFLSHGVYRQLALIQISDIFGAYGVSFVLAMLNGFLADVLLRRRPPATPSAAAPGLFRPALATLLVIAATTLYGVHRLREGVFSPGPKVAVLQGDYPLSVSESGPAPSPIEKANKYFELLEAAALQQPDLFLFPETPWWMSLNDAFLEAKTFPYNSAKYEAMQRISRASQVAVQEAASTHQAYVVVGAGSTDFHPREARPQDQVRRYNSAFVYAPNLQNKHRYDKVVLVMFGEYLPFRNNRWLHWLYRWLDRMHPFREPNEEFSLANGRQFSTFEMTDRSGTSYRFGVPICFEDLIPRVSRAFARSPDGGKKIDFLLSISNDGWFNYGPLVPQHLGVCAFRAVENRVGIARAVNTACSSFIDPSGRIHHVVNDHGRVLGAGIFGYEVAAVQVDERSTLYTRFGDWFGVCCTLLAAAAPLIARLVKPA